MQTSTEPYKLACMLCRVQLILCKDNANEHRIIQARLYVMPSAAYLMQRYYKIFNLDNNAKLVDAKKDKKKNTLLEDVPVCFKNVLDKTPLRLWRLSNICICRLSQSPSSLSCQIELSMRPFLLSKGPLHYPMTTPLCRYTQQ
jgi:hypothetical protein